jgi:hypothetical protein
MSKLEGFPEAFKNNLDAANKMADKARPVEKKEQEKNTIRQKFCEREM